MYYNYKGIMCMYLHLWYLAPTHLALDMDPGTVKSYTPGHPGVHVKCGTPQEFDVFDPKSSKLIDFDELC